MLSRISVMSLVAVGAMVVGIAAVKSRQPIYADTTGPTVTIRATTGDGSSFTGDIAHVIFCCYPPQFYNATLTAAAPSATFNLPPISGAPANFYSSVSLPDRTLTLVGSGQQHVTLKNGDNITITYLFNKILASPSPSPLASPSPSPAATTVASAEPAKPSPTTKASPKKASPKATKKPSPSHVQAKASPLPTPSLSPSPSAPAIINQPRTVVKRNPIQAFFAALFDILIFWD